MFDLRDTYPPLGSTEKIASDIRDLRDMHASLPQGLPIKGRSPVGAATTDYAAKGSWAVPLQPHEQRTGAAVNVTSVDG